jgi:hypothetical protein
MKKAIIILYVIVIVQGLCTIIGFAVSAQVLKISLYEAGKSITGKYHGTSGIILRRSVGSSSLSSTMKPSTARSP